MSSVLVVIAKEKEISNKLTWGVRFSQAMKMPLIVIHPEKYPKHQEPVPQELDQPCSQPILEAIRQQLVEQELELEPTLHFLQGPNPLSQILEFTQKEEVALLLTGQQEIHNDNNRVLRKKHDGLLDRASCDVMVLRGPEAPPPLKKILVPIAGGPHAAAALKLAFQLIEVEEEAVITALHIESAASEEAEGVGQLVLERILGPMPTEARSRIKSKIVLSDNVIDGIEQTAKEGEFDLVLLGASNTGFLHKSLFGNIPVKLLQRPINGTIGVLHASQPAAQKAVDYLRYQFNRILPQLKREERITLFENLQSGSKVSIDFIALIGLSTMIAAFGLINNAAAVIIGAMLVAPLMTPMIGTGLGLVQGNVNLVKEAIRAIAIGFVLSLFLGFLSGLLGMVKLGVHPPLTSELLARCSVNEYDFLIALLSGIAAAYALARPGLMAALPGVAIAAALVPPIATVGVTIAWGYPDLALRAASLFGINLLSIILASTLTLYVFGIRARHKQPRLWARRATVMLMMLAFIVSVPLGTIIVGQVRAVDTLRASVQKLMSQEAYHSLADLKRIPQKDNQPETIVLKLYSKRPVNVALARKLTQHTRKHLKKPNILVRIISLQTWEIQK